MTRHGRRGILRVEFLWAGGLGVGFLGIAAVLGTIPTTLNDFFFGGTQPGVLTHPIADVSGCSVCHGGYNAQAEPFRLWASTMMGQSARDPIFHAALAIANQDAAFAGDLCLRCHAPGGWVQGRSEPPDGSALTDVDMQGVNCNFCHRMVNPVLGAGSPAPDAAILAGLPFPPVNPGSANYVIDPQDRRRGPFDLTGQTFYHAWLQSPFHQAAQMCATCHDVSNPAYTRQPDGTYALGPLDTPHPTGDKYDMFPIERTFSEWSQSAFAQGPINMGGRFGGNNPLVSTCQDCHMPDATGKGCAQGPTRNDEPMHFFNGGNTWVLRAINALYPDWETFLEPATIDASIARAQAMLAAASDMELSVQGTSLNVRVINQTGHKLPTGYSEGRRMWVNVKFRDASNAVVAERGAYDPATAVLNGSDTKVYEGHMGIDAAVSALTGIPAGETFHFALNNVWYKDNRIPPRGFTNAGFASVQASPAGCYYADGQYWDDTHYLVPPAARTAEVTVYYQTTSKEYIEFLRDANTTNNAGQIAYDQWVMWGRSAPAVMDQGVIQIPCYPNCDNSVTPPVLNVLDFSCFLNKFAAGDPYANCDASTTPPVLNVLDFSCFLNRFAAGCP
jgi:hypothetical protein